MKRFFCVLFVILTLATLFSGCADAKSESSSEQMITGHFYTSVRGNISLFSTGNVQEYVNCLEVLEEGGKEIIDIAIYYYGHVGPKYVITYRNTD